MPSYSRSNLNVGALVSAAIAAGQAKRRDQDAFMQMGQTLSALGNQDVAQELDRDRLDVAKDHAGLRAKEFARMIGNDKALQTLIPQMQAQAKYDSPRSMRGRAALGALGMGAMNAPRPGLDIPKGLTGSSGIQLLQLLNNRSEGAADRNTDYLKALLKQQTSREKSYDEIFKELDKQRALGNYSSAFDDLEVLKGRPQFKEEATPKALSRELLGGKSGVTPTRMVNPVNKQGWTQGMQDQYRGAREDMAAALEEKLKAEQEGRQATEDAEAWWNMTYPGKKPPVSYERMGSMGLENVRMGARYQDEAPAREQRLENLKTTGTLLSNRLDKLQNELRGKGDTEALKEAKSALTFLVNDIDTYTRDMTNPDFVGEEREPTNRDIERGRELQRRLDVLTESIDALGGKPALVPRLPDFVGDTTTGAEEVNQLDRRDGESDEDYMLRVLGEGRLPR